MRRRGSGIRVAGSFLVVGLALTACSGGGGGTKPISKATRSSSAQVTRTASQWAVELNVCQDPTKVSADLVTCDGNIAVASDDPGDGLDSYAYALMVERNPKACAVFGNGWNVAAQSRARFEEFFMESVEDFASQSDGKVYCEKMQ